MGSNEIRSIKCELRPNCDTVLAAIIYENGMIKERRLTSLDFVDMLNGSIVAKTEYRELGRLPNGLLNVWTTERNDTFIAKYHVPSGIRPLNYHGMPFVIHFPDIVFYLMVREGHLTISYVFAIRSDADPQQDDCELYHYPFGNVYDSGRICWGTNHLEQVSTIAESENYLLTFFGSETNDDLYYPGRSVAVGPNNFFVNQRGLLETVAGKEFDDAWLMPVNTTVRTFEDDF